VGLQGNLEDLPLLDIIQIVSFSKKTGYLSIEMEGGDGAIVFVDGLVVSAFTADSPPADPRLASLPLDARERAVRSRIGFALEQLARLREGAFGFELSEAVPETVGSRDIRLETLVRGINPQELLLELAQGLDEDRAQSAAAVEASFAAPEEAVVEEAPAIVPAAAAAVDLPPPIRPPNPPPAPAYPASAPEPRPYDTAPMPAIARPAPAEPPALEATAPGKPVSEAPVHEAPEPPAPGSTPAPAVAQTILLVDDEQDVRDVLGQHFADAGYTVEEAEDPEQALKAAGRLREAGRLFVLVTDLGMPATGGASFHGGFEVVKRLWKMNLRPPVLMMTDMLSQSLRLRAKQMGVKAFVFKPTLSKLNSRQFEADLSAFAAKLVQDVLPRLAEAAVLQPPVVREARAAGAAAAPSDAPRAAEPEDGDTQPVEFLKRRLVELRRGGDANEIASLVMKVAREFFERAILFVIKNDEVRGLGGFGLAPRDETLNLVARQVAIPLGQPSLFRDVALNRRPFAGPLPQDRWTGHLMGRIGRFQSREVAVLPLVAHRDTIALLFGDNPESSRPLERLAALEVFVEQAGIALENVFLQRKLQTIEERDRAGLR
jgi:CheY-like chemotaxis protein